LSSVPLLRWGEQSGVLAEAASTLAEMFADRLASRAAWLRTTSPPVIYLIIVMSIGFAVTSLFIPLISLIQGLA
jgi:type II secretory pathway component PulF